MQLFFEDDGSFKAGDVLQTQGNAYQVQLTTGRRTKIKQSHVFFSFEQPSAAGLLEKAKEMSETLDVPFLWEVAPEEEFSFEVLAKEYWGGEEGPIEKAALIFALHANPVYFYRKNRGNYRRAPQEILERALVALEKRQKQEQMRRQWVEEMVAGELPKAIGDMAMTLLVRPDKNGIEWKALSDAAANTRQTPLRLLLSLGAIASPWRWHVDSFFAQNFPQGRKFAPSLSTVPAIEMNFPKASANAFSIDDSETTEIDDAMSVEDLGNGLSRVGVHISVPALGVLRDEPVDLAARLRMSTIYAPGLKTTMMPEEWAKAFSLDEGQERPCISLYLTVNNEDYIVEKTETRLEMITVQANLRHDKMEEQVTEEAILNGTLEIPYSKEITFLWHLGKSLLGKREQVRGRPEAQGRVDWYFALEDEGEDAKIRIKGRRRGAPLDLIIAELMIFANSTWGSWLEEHGTPGIYRSQRMGRVRMSTTPGPHDGLGVHRYAWSSSPLRRYVDLVNQRQLIATLEGRAPAYQGNDIDLFSVVTQFDAIYTLYRDFQSRMERYWSLRWIIQEKLETVEAIVLKGDLVCIDGLPFIQRIPGLPELERGQKIRLSVLSCDLVDLVMDTRVLEVLEDGLSDEEAAYLDEQSDQEESNPEVTQENTDDTTSK